MKWNKENKERLYRALNAKIRDIVNSTELGLFHDDWVAFCESFGIVTLRRATGREKWKKREGVPATRKTHIIIKDPWFGRDQSECGLSIPKDVAEKILVLGIP